MNRTEFLRQPNGILFAKYQGDKQIGSLKIKIKTDGNEFDFYNIVDFKWHGIEMSDIFDRAEKDSSLDIPLSSSQYHDSTMNQDQLFAVFSHTDCVFIQTIIESARLKLKYSE